MENRDNVARRRNLFYSIDYRSHFNRILDYFTDTHFFVKDREGRILFASVSLVKLYGYKSEDEFIGRTDFDVLPDRFARKFHEDDLRVMGTGEPLIGVVELFLSPGGVPDWYITNKVPLWSDDHRVVGLMGTIREHRRSITNDQPGHDVDRVAAHLRATYAENEPVSELAAMCNLSTRRLEAKFREAYNTSPHQFRLRLRVMKACELLRRSDASIPSTAATVGFYDQSALAFQLKKTMGYTPLQYRKRFTEVGAKPVPL